jgi:hypothetical protein
MFIGEKNLHLISIMDGDSDIVDLESHLMDSSVSSNKGEMFI